jgi:hypothetical protein
MPGAESGLDAPADIDALNQKSTHLEQQGTDLRLTLEDRDDELVRYGAGGETKKPQFVADPLANAGRSGPGEGRLVAGAQGGVVGVGLLDGFGVCRDPRPDWSPRYRHARPQ